MVLKTIKLKNFRSHKETLLNFSEKLNYIVGGNGQGKTSVLEAIYYLCTTKSNSSRSDSEAVRFQEKEFEISGAFSGPSENKVNILYSAGENKKYYYKDGKHIYKAADIIGKFPVVMLTPGDHSITQGSPADRRMFVDSIIAQASETYLRNLLDYNKTLRQRASLLNQIKTNSNKSISDELDAWSSILIRTGSYLIKQRREFIKDFNVFAGNSYSSIMGDSETPSIEYTTLENYTGEDVEKEFTRLLTERKEEEIIRGTNLVGPQRDDFIFGIDGHNLKAYGSQGQHKTFQVALRFAEFFYLKEKSGTSPVFLLDDVFGELDANRSAKISIFLADVGQAFVTMTDFTDFSFLEKRDGDKIINLKEGKVAYA
jgi:DNA replication and repair protein RecF